MKCYNCGFENDETTSFCRECGVNLRRDDMGTFKDNVDVLNKEFNVDKRRKSHTVPSTDSIQARLLYKQDKYSGKLRLAKTKCATIVVFSGFFFFSLAISLFAGNIFLSFVISIAFGLVFAIPVAIIGTVIGYAIDKITH